MKRVDTTHLESLSTRLLYKIWNKAEDCALVHSKPSFEAGIDILVVLVDENTTYSALARVKIFV